MLDPQGPREGPGVRIVEDGEVNITPRGKSSKCPQRQREVIEARFGRSGG